MRKRFIAVGDDEPHGPLRLDVVGWWNFRRAVAELEPLRLLAHGVDMHVSQNGSVERLRLDCVDRREREIEIRVDIFPHDDHVDVVQWIRAHEVPRRLRAEAREYSAERPRGRESAERVTAPWPKYVVGDSTESGEFDARMKAWPAQVAPRQVAPQQVAPERPPPAPPPPPAPVTEAAARIAGLDFGDDEKETER